MENDVISIVKQFSRKIQDEYQRIQIRSTEDPGTAGDNGEENWKYLLTQWLPSKYKIVTKGRIMNSKGKCSPQVDILVLSPAYPQAMVDTKEYFAGGVMAAFECKLTLKKEHIKKSLETAAIIARLVDEEYHRTPYQELNSPLIYGLLAHSHTWKGKKSKPNDNIETAIHYFSNTICKHPREVIDLVCIADIAVWTSHKMIIYGKDLLKQLKPRYSSNVNAWKDAQKCSGLIETNFCQSSRSTQQTEKSREAFTPVGSFISELMEKMAWRDEDMKPIVQYFTRSNVRGGGQGYCRIWPLSVLNSQIINELSKKGLSTGNKWNEWSINL